MAKTKENKKKNKTAAASDGKRKETKEERALRLQSQAEAREKCFKALPYVGGAIALLLLIFALYVRSVPRRITTTIPVNTTLTPETMTRIGPEGLETLVKSDILTHVEDEDTSYDEVPPEAATDISQEDLTVSTKPIEDMGDAEELQKDVTMDVTEEQGAGTGSEL